MRIRIRHETIYRYASPPSGVIQVLRLTPRNHDGQYIVDWRIDVSEECRLDTQEDAFGNLTHTFAAAGPFTELSVLVEGEVETQDTHGIVRGAIERFPPTLFLRDTPLTAADPAIADYARAIRVQSRDETLAVLHALLERLHRDIVYDTEPTHAATTAQEAFALKRGVCQDHAHIFIAAARTLGIPSRYAGGYFHRADGLAQQEAGHAWAEAFVPELGWVGFDPANGISPTEAHVRVAIGLDYLGAAPVRGSRYGGGAELLAVVLHIDQAGRQLQQQ
jgi:transglutaminase-like putative cysteine protease